MQKPNEPLVRKMPLPIDIQFADGTSLSDGWQTITHKDTSHIRILSIDADGFLAFEVTPPKKITSKNLSEYFVDGQLIATENTVVATDGKIVGQYRYFKRPDGTYFASVMGETSSQPHKIELGSLSDHDSDIFTIARTIAFKLDTKKFSRKDLKLVIPHSLTYGQKLKALLDVLYHEGYLTREIDQTSRNKSREIYEAIGNLKKVVIPSPTPEQP